VSAVILRRWDDHADGFMCEGERGMQRYDWARLNKLQVGKYAEYFVKMEFTMIGFEVYTTEVDYRCIDFVARWPTG
jgi:hypothetical protein